MRRAWGRLSQRCWQRRVKSLRINASETIMTLSQENKILNSAIPNSSVKPDNQRFLEFRAESPHQLFAQTIPILQI